MIQFVCDTCSAVKQPGQTWVLGLAAESVGVTAARREATIISGWDSQRALDPLAIHFCSLSCKDDYMQRLFGDGIKAEGILIARGAPEVISARRLPGNRTVVTRSLTRKARPRKKAA